MRTLRLLSGTLRVRPQDSFIKSQNEALPPWTISCTACGGEAVAQGEPRALQLFVCEKCGAETYAHCNYAIDVSLIKDIKAYQISVDVPDPSNIVKLSLKVRRLFRGKRNFSEDRLDQYISAQQSFWDLGLYSEAETNDLRVQAKEIGVALKCELRRR